MEGGNDRVREQLLKTVGILLRNRNLGGRLRCASNCLLCRRLQSKVYSCMRSYTVKGDGTLFAEASSLRAFRSL